MTEQQLRQKVADIIGAWVGATKGSATHLKILSIYNGYKPLAGGYTMKTTDAYCATTVSAAWISAGIAAYTGTECSVDRFIRLAQDKGIWVENDAYVPKMGDAICYDWDDSGTGDNTGVGDHIGIVTTPGSATFTVTEGNMSGGKVGTRTMKVNGKYIRGFITPNYANIAKALNGETTTSTTSTATTTTSGEKTVAEIAKEVVAGKWGNGSERKNKLMAAGYAYSAVQAAVNELLGGTSSSSDTSTASTTTASSSSGKTLVAAEKFDRSISGAYTVTATNGLNIRYGPGTEYDIIKTLAKGTKVNNYGYYSVRDGVTWYSVRCGATVGFMSSAYLTKA